MKISPFLIMVLLIVAGLGLAVTIFATELWIGLIVCFIVTAVWGLDNRFKSGDDKPITDPYLVIAWLSLVIKLILSIFKMI